MRPGSSFPAALGSVLWLRIAHLSRADESLDRAFARRSFGIADIAQQMRRLFGSRGGSGRQDVPHVAEDEEMKRSSPEDAGPAA